MVFMRIAAILYLVMTVLIFDQLVTGGPFALGTGNLAGAFGDFHFIMGFITGILSIVVVIAAWLAKPAYKAFRYTTLVILILFFLVGFTSDKTALSVGIIPHYEFAVILFGAAIAGTFYAIRWNRMPKPTAAPIVTSQ